MAVKDLTVGARDEDHDHSKAHRDQHYLLMLITDGHFKFNLDFREVITVAPVLLRMFRGQVHHSMEIYRMPLNVDIIKQLGIMCRSS